MKNLPAMPDMQEMKVRSTGREGPLEKEMAPHSSILAWEISRTEEPGGATVHGVSKSWIRLKQCLNFAFIDVIDI